MIAVHRSRLVNSTVIQRIHVWRIHVWGFHHAICRQQVNWPNAEKPRGIVYSRVRDQIGVFTTQTRHKRNWTGCWAFSGGCHNQNDQREQEYGEESEPGQCQRTVLDVAIIYHRPLALADMVGVCLCEDIGGR
jgi:hypothetical protein